MAVKLTKSRYYMARNDPQNSGMKKKIKGEENSRRKLLQIKNALLFVFNRYKH